MNLGPGDRDGWTPLHTAVWMGQKAIIKRLIAAGASLNANTNNRHTALHFAAMRNYIGAAYALIEAGARVDLADKYDRMTMNWAVLNYEEVNVEVIADPGVELTDF